MAILGTYHWLLYNAKSSLVPPPTTLLDELCWIIVLRRQPGLDYALRSVALSVKHFPELFNESHLDELCRALEGLDVETQLDGKGSQQSEDRFEAIERYERPWYRRLAADLAYRLTIELTARQKDIPQILSRWHQITQTDDLPLVRNVWPQASLDPILEKQPA